MRLTAGLLTGCAVAWTAPALAGTEPLYQPAPAWVAPAELPAELTGPNTVLFDNQHRIETGRLHEYQDTAVRIDNPQMLDALGTVQARWIPDKGDLIVHRVAILRNGETIDVLGQGARFDVLRRELQLEQRMIDGASTATLAVPGLRVGDVLRVSYSVTSSDQALDEEVQTLAPLMTEPFEAGFARVIVSWPVDAEVKWHATGGVELPEPEVRDGYRTIEVALPLAEREDVPPDAPVRFRMPPLLQAGTFADWEEVSRVMAPLYATDGAIAAGGPLAEQVAAIEAAHSDPLARAVAALRLVQDEISYLANGMEGGNYIPQAPAETWSKRYGDCKAKTLLLLSLLRAMGIEAEPVLVASSTGDGVPGMLPMPAAFDHVIVRATIGGETFWLDGTDSGASLALARQAPRFAHALPLRTEGSGLVPIEPRPREGYDGIARFRFDHRAGLDIPMLYEAEFVVSGSRAAPLRSVIDRASEEQRLDFLRGFGSAMVGESQVIDGSVSFDADRNEATVRVSGLMTTPWRWERGVASRSFDLPTDDFTFRPDRGRRAWREIPVALPGPASGRAEITVLLPEAGRSYTLDGKTAFEEDIAGVRLGRTASIDGNVLTIADWRTARGGELPAADIPAERAKAARLGSLELQLRAPEGARRRFAFAGSADRSALAPIEAAYAKLIDKEPDEAENYQNRALFRALTFDRDGALEDLDMVVDLAPSATVYFQRARLLMEMGRMEDALADAEQGGELDPGISATLFRANVMSYLDRVDEAIALLEEQDGNAEERRAIAMALSDLEAAAGRKEDGLRRIDDLLGERPGDPALLNGKCWYQATWNLQEGLAELCTKAVELADWSPPVLDSRAMAYFRLGRFEEALKDIDAALSASPELVPSLLMRGVVRRAMGDKGGQDDIRSALARSPSLAPLYTRFGIKLD